MPMFYINFQKADCIARALEGEEFDDLQQAVAAAMESGRELLANDIRSHSTDPLLAVVITNNRDEEVAIIEAKELLPDRLR